MAEVKNNAQVPDSTDDLAQKMSNLQVEDTTEGTTATGEEKTTKPATKRRRNKKKSDKDAAATSGNEGDQQADEVPKYDNTAKIFVGNLSFKTTEDELKEFFSAAGAITEVEVITRGTRSMGYGFVSFETEVAADKAVELFDKKELGERAINVERARDKEPGEITARSVRGRRGGPRGRGRRGGLRGRRRSAAGSASSSKSPARVDEEEAPAGQDGHASAQERDADGAPVRGRGGRGRGGRGRGRGRRFSTGRRDPAEHTNAETSKTTIFVANLPFKVTDEDLASIFKDYQVSNAHVVKVHSGRSKGFGFVTVANEEEQQKVLNELKNVVVDGRELVIKVALASQTPPSDNQEGGSGDGEAQTQEGAVAGGDPYQQW
ncbi:hypothetical protein HDU85_000808 [Gaertneriomyces sp. JEL0708]|nr:hypothetical protein HDU85_000808 [Gaertneriomyces sp. JEL0708]